MSTPRLDAGDTDAREPDDLKRISGIGPAIERHLHDAGVRTFAQLAALTPEQIAALVADLPLLSAERIIRQDWVGRARDLARAADMPLPRRDGQPDAGRRSPSPSGGTAALAHRPGRASGIAPADDDPADDLPVSNLAFDPDERVSVAPSYGEMGSPQRVGGDVSIEPVGDVRLPTAGAPPEPPAAPDDTPPLDAWFAGFGHPTLTRLLQQPEALDLLARLGADSDGRAEIIATEEYPWRCICALTITAADGSRWLGTGWLAGPRLVITAGHCLYMPCCGGWARQVEVTPGRRGDEQPYGACLSTSFRSVRGWVYRGRASHNYGAIILPADRAFGNLLGHLGYLTLGDHDLRGLDVNLAGYPSDRPRGTLWYASHRLTIATARTLEYPVSTLGGESGAPVWQLRDERRYVVGIHTGGGTAASAVRLSAPVFANLAAWRQESA